MKKQKEKPVQFNETDLYPPIKKFFSELGYEINAEVKGCDVAMMKNGELVIIELKKAFNMTLLYQAIERQKLTSQVYVGVPRPKKVWEDSYRKMAHILKKLEIGLITVAMDSPLRSVEIVCLPPAQNSKGKDKRRRNNVIKEMQGRTIDENLGGSTKRKLMTAYREKSVRIACALSSHGVLTAAQLVREYGCDAYAYKIMRQNHYNWFEFLGTAKFALSEDGAKMLESGEFSELVNFYKKYYEEKNQAQDTAEVIENEC